MNKLLFITLSLCVALLASAAKVNKFVNVKVGTQTRKYLLYVPNNVKADAPVVISLHGAGGTVTTTSHDPDFNPIADKDDAITVTDLGLYSMTAEEMTGIKGVSSKEGSSRGVGGKEECYDLQGRRLLSAPSRPGLYVIGNKKVSVK